MNALTWKQGRYQRRNGGVGESMYRTEHSEGVSARNATVGNLVGWTIPER